MKQRESMSERERERTAGRHYGFCFKLEDHMCVSSIKRERVRDFLVALHSQGIPLIVLLEPLETHESLQHTHILYMPTPSTPTDLCHNQNKSIVSIHQHPLKVVKLLLKGWY